MRPSEYQIHFRGSFKPGVIKLRPSRAFKTTLHHDNFIYSGKKQGKNSFNSNSGLGDPSDNKRIPRIPAVDCDNHTFKTGLAEFFSVLDLLNYTDSVADSEFNLF